MLAACVLQRCGWRGVASGALREELLCARGVRYRLLRGDRGAEEQRCGERTDSCAREGSRQQAATLRFLRSSLAHVRYYVRKAWRDESMMAEF